MRRQTEVSCAWRGAPNATFTIKNFENDLRQKRNPVVHIATHFESRPGVAANSHLLLGNGELSLAEIELEDRLFKTELIC